MSDEKITHVGQRILIKGYATTVRSILVNGRDATSIEKNLGYTPGSLRRGYWFLILGQGEKFEQGEIQFRGYTHLKDGKPKGQKKNVFDSRMASYSAHKIDQDSQKKLIASFINRVNRTGVDRMCKILPKEYSDVDYVPGTGILQDELMVEKHFVVVENVGPAALISPAPEPSMIRGQHRNAPLLNTIQHQQRPLIRPVHHRRA